MKRTLSHIKNEKTLGNHLWKRKIITYWACHFTAVSSHKLPNIFTNAYVNLGTIQKQEMQGQCSHSTVHPGKQVPCSCGYSVKSVRVQAGDTSTLRGMRCLLQRHHVPRSTRGQRAHRMTDIMRCDSLQKPEGPQRTTRKCKDHSGPEKSPGSFTGELLEQPLESAAHGTNMEPVGLEALPHGQSHVLGPCAVLCLLVAQKNWESCLLHFCFSKLMHLPLLMNMSQSHQHKLGYRFPSYSTDYTIQQNHLPSIFMPWGLLNSMHGVQFHSKMQDNEQRTDYKHNRWDCPLSYLSTTSNWCEEHTCGIQLQQPNVEGTRFNNKNWRGRSILSEAIPVSATVSQKTNLNRNLLSCSHTRKRKGRFKTLLL